MSSEGNIEITLPKQALRLMEVLESANIESWIVGGFVRDAVLGKTGADIDLACSAHWQETQRVCEQAGMHTHETGVKHGTLTVVVDDMAFEVTTFRQDGVYTKNRRPKTVEFVQSILEDLARRDFTINAIAYRPQVGFVDPYGGIADIQNKVIRAVGAPEVRFKEDALRVLRACRFAAQLGFEIEGETKYGMLQNKYLLTNISDERITAELNKLLLAPNAGDVIIEHTDVLSAVLPELVAMQGFNQKNQYHIYDMLVHSAKTVDGAPATLLLRWAALLHDIGKPASYCEDKVGQGHAYGHAAIGARLANGALQRFCFSQKFINDVVLLVRHHDDSIPTTKRGVKRMLGRLNDSPELFYALCDLKIADARAHAPEFINEQVENANELRAMFKSIQANGEPFSVRDLAINGSDVMALGVEQGTRVGQLLHIALDAVIDGKVENAREQLLAFVKSAI